MILRMNQIDIVLNLQGLQKMKKETIYQYIVISEPAEEGGYVVPVPALPGCIIEGDSLEEAREMAKDAIKGYLESTISK